jgi:hypothetical protein
MQYKLFIFFVLGKIPAGKEILVITPVGNNKD